MSSLANVGLYCHFDGKWNAVVFAGPAGGLTGSGVTPWAALRSLARQVEERYKGLLVDNASEAVALSAAEVE